MMRRMMMRRKAIILGISAPNTAKADETPAGTTQLS